MNLLQDVTFACLDTETTGLSPLEGGRVCEIAVCLSKGGEMQERYSTLINPGLPIAPAVTAIHGITDQMVADAPSFADIIPQLVGLLNGAVVVAHNADFDLTFLRAEFEACGLTLPQTPVIDTLKLARKSGLFAKNNLGHIAAQLGISAAGWHRAMADTLMTEQILYYFLATLHKQGVQDLEHLTRFQTQRWADLLKKPEGETK